MTGFANTYARDWFADEAEFRQLCGDAQSLARSESAQEFAAEMVIRAKTHGLNAFLSHKQLVYLCKLADCDPPARINDNSNHKRRGG
jgi:hypothetical protein